MVANTAKNTCSVSTYRTPCFTAKSKASFAKAFKSVGTNGPEIFSSTSGFNNSAFFNI